MQVSNDPLIRHLRANKGKRIAVAGLGGRFEWFFSISLSHKKCITLRTEGSKLARLDVTSQCSHEISKENLPRARVRRMHSFVQVQFTRKI